MSVTNHKDLPVVLSNTAPLSTRWQLYTNIPLALFILLIFYFIFADTGQYFKNKFQFKTNYVLN